ncbi:MAG: hypothetical protein ABI325_08345 [Ginsengibacter sp.]
MKHFLSLIFYILSSAGYSQVNSAMSPEADLFYNHAMQTINSKIKSTIEKNANNLKNRIVDTDSLSGFLRSDESLKNITSKGIDAIAILIMVQISKNADADLKNMVVNMQKDNEKSLSKGNSHSAIVEVILNNKSQIAANVSVLMQKLGSSRDLAVDNLK